MTFRFYERLSFYLTLAISVVLIAVTREVAAAFWAGALAVLVLTALYWRAYEKPVLKSATMLTVFAVAFALVDVRYLAPNYLVAIIDLVLLLLILKLLGERRVADNLQMIGLSFLLVLGASVITVEAIFGLLLLVYVFSGLAALVLQNLRGHWESSVGESEALANRRGVLGGAFGVAVGVIAAGILVFTLVLYFAFPRVGLRWWRVDMNYRTAVSGFSDTVSLNGVGRIDGNPAVAVRMIFGGGELPAPGSPLRKLRGIALDHFDGVTWRATQRSVAALPKTGRRSWKLADAPAARRVGVIPESEYASVVFVPPGAVGLEGDFSSVMRTNTGNLVVQRRPSKRLAYTVSLAEATAGSDAPTDAATRMPEGFSPRVAELAKEWSQGVTGPPMAARFADRLRSRYAYTTNLTEGDGDAISAFLFETRAGHCELFATSLALLLRSRGVPTRVVNGFSGGDEWSADTLVFRELHAHSWVEAYFPESGWVEYDPTPGVETALPWYLAAQQAYSDTLARLRFFWGEWFVDYDHDRQRAVVAEFARASERVGGTLNRRALIDWWRANKPIGLGAAGYALAALFLSYVAVALFRRLRRTRHSARRISALYLRRLQMAERVRRRLPGQSLLRYAGELAAHHAGWEDFVAYTAVYYKLRFGMPSADDGLRFLQLHAQVPRRRSSSNAGRSSATRP